MAVAKVIEIISGSKVGFDDAIKQGIARTSDTVSGISSAWVKEQSVVVEGGKIAEYRVAMMVTFMVNAPSKSAAKKKQASEPGSAARDAFCYAGTCVGPRSSSAIASCSQITRRPIFGAHLRHSGGASKYPHLPVGASTSRVRSVRNRARRAAIGGEHSSRPEGSLHHHAK